MANLIGEDVLGAPTALACARCGGPVARGEFYRRRLYRGALWRPEGEHTATWAEVEHLRCPEPQGGRSDG